MLKKAFLSIFALVFLLAMVPSQAQTISVGGGLCYGTEIEEIALDIRGIYSINEQIRIGGDIQYFFVEDPLSFMAINANAHYMFINTKDTKAYGLAGLNYARQSFSFMGVTSSNSEIGLNIGGGAQFNIGGPDLFIEGKYTIGDFDQVVIGAGVLFSI